MNRYILNRSGLGSSLAYMLADALDSTIPVDDWVPLIGEVVSDNHGLYDESLGSMVALAAADLAAVPKRDPSCEDLITPYLHFKGYKIIQMHRLAHILFNAGREQLALTI